MSEKQEPKSPFSERQLEFKEGNARLGSRPAVRPDDKRLTDGRVRNLRPGYHPGINGKPQTKPLTEALRKKMEEKAAAEGKTFAELWAELILKGADGTVRLTPSQTTCIQIIRDTIEGKPGTAQEDEKEQTAVFLDDIVATE